jgi:hypothetical protein
MFTHRSAVRFAIARSPWPFNQSANQSATRFAGAILLLAVLAGCTTAPSVSLAVADPADPDAPARAVRYSPVLAGYSSQRPVAPMPWRERNERVTPKGEAQ